MPNPRLIAFEGVDGAGKTTVLALVADALRQKGHKVFLPRSGKEHDSVPTRMIRRLTRDPTNFDLTATAELLLYCAREAQVLEELVRPALKRGETVLIDRSLLTPVVLGAFGRQLDRGLCESSAQAASLGLQPDVTLIFDVHPRTSRVRKRLEKIRTRPAADGGGRKGLAGSGFKERVRDGYLAIAKERGYPVFHAERATPKVVAERVLAFLEQGLHPEVTESPEDSRPVWMVDPQLTLEQGLQLAPLSVALFLTNGLISQRKLRAEAFAQEPELVAWGLDPEDPLRTLAAETQPDYALRGLSKRPLSGADDLRLRALERAPSAALNALKFVESPEADALRERYASAVPGAVLSSLSGRSDTFALRLRAQLWKEAELPQRAASIAFCSDEDAWKRREKLFESVPYTALGTLRGIQGPAVDEALKYYAPRIPKAVLGALTGRSDALAHQLRREVLHVGREAIDSVRGLDDVASWQLREEFAERSPSTVLHSLEGLPTNERLKQMRQRCEQIGAGDLHTARRARGLDEFPQLPAWHRARASFDSEA
jgi:dTMP kinase